MDDDLFQRANATDIEAIIGEKLFRAGRRLRGPCPVCGASKGKRADGAFWVDPDAGRWGCFSGNDPCGRGGDAVAMEQLLRGGSAREAAERLAGQGFQPPAQPQPQPPRTPPMRPAAEADQWKAALARDLWRGSAPAGCSLVQAYLSARGIRGAILDQALRQVRFHPAAYHSGSVERAVRLPAMIGLIRTHLGPTGGVHVTYLAPDGRAKAQRQPAKRMWGPQSAVDRGRVLPGGVWLSHPQAEGGLVVAEGIESALSAAILLGGPRRVVAALSLDRLQGGQIADRWGRVDPQCVTSDPERPAFTWPEDPAAPWGEVAVAVDRDMAAVWAKIRKATGGTARVQLSGEDRARICAGLAAQAWRRAGASVVRTIAPGPGRDFNNELMALAGEPGGARGGGQ